MLRYVYLHAQVLRCYFLASPEKERKSSFSVKSGCHPSMKMKMAAKAKSRASQSEEKIKAPEDVKKQPATKVPAAKRDPRVDLAKVREPVVGVFQRLSKGRLEENNR